MVQGLTTQLRHLETRMAIDQSVSTMSIEGVISPMAGRHVFAACHAGLREQRPKALVAVYASADMRLSAESMFRCAATVLSKDDELRLPTALLVRPDDMEMWRTYCHIQGMNGVLRAAFTDSAAAQRWAAEHAALWDAQRAARRLP